MKPIDARSPRRPTGRGVRRAAVDARATPTLRLARRADLAGILGLLAEDAISAARGASPVEPTAATEAAFAEIESDPAHELWVAETEHGLVAALQLSFIPGLTRNGMRRAQVEAVRVRGDRRGSGIGSELMRHVIERARERGCGLMQLTSDRRRDAAHRFYARLGFVGSHLGMKLELPLD
jgi:GNAT superfamily N-acetyltransferase